MANRIGKGIWAQHVAVAAASGLSGAAYCRQHGLNAKTFGRWVRLSRAGDGSALAPPSRVPLMIVASRAGEAAVIRIELGPSR